MTNMQKCLVFAAFIALFAMSTAAQATIANGQIVKVALTKEEQKTVADFEKAAQNYVAIVERVREQLPKLSGDATPEQIAIYKQSLRQGVQMTWANAVPGDIFRPDAGAFVKARIKEEFKGWERSELRKTVLEADTRVPLKINTPYPETKELVEMSPALLLALPPLPKQLRYRFIGRSLAILDRENALIVDYMRDALP